MYTPNNSPQTPKVHGRLAISKDEGDKPRLMKYWKVAGEFLKKSRKITGDQ